MKSNQDLKEIYERVFKEGAEQFFTKYKDGKDQSENDSVVLRSLGEVQGKRILDVGCGTGSLAFELSKRGAAKVTGIDYSGKAIEIAASKFQAANLTFRCMNVLDWSEPVDIVVSCGTFEHMDDPPGILEKMATFIPTGGIITLTCPHFYNLRGFIWITLQKLLNVPMSLTDLHSISPADMQRWAQGASLSVESFETFDHTRANGPAVISDLHKRLTNALRDADLPNDRVEAMLEWVADLIRYQEQNPDMLRFEGMNGLHKLIKTK